MSDSVQSIADSRKDDASISGAYPASPADDLDAWLNDAEDVGKGGTGKMLGHYRSFGHCKEISSSVGK